MWVPGWPDFARVKCCRLWCRRSGAAHELCTSPVSFSSYTLCKDTENDMRACAVRHLGHAPRARAIYKRVRCAEGRSLTPLMFT